MVKQLVFSKNNLFFYFLLFGYIFGVILYDFIGFKYTDELMAFFLVLFTGIIVWERRSIRGLRPLIIVGGIFLFYTIYSFIISSNIPQAIFKDLVIQMKPFLGFYCAYLLAPTLTHVQKRVIILLCLIVGGLIIIVGVTDNVWAFFGHPSRLATAATVTALLFLYCSSYSRSDIFFFIILLSIGFLSTRSKFYGFWGISFFLIIYYKFGGKIKINLNSAVVISILICIAIVLSWEKIVVYYITGAMDSHQMWSRPAMMVTAFFILFDYFPFGCGLASFGTFASSEYYSNVYEKYNLNQLHGLTKNNPAFISDAFYPELAQFGIVGVILYFYFWIWVVKAAIHKQVQSQKQFVMILLIFIFFLVEGIADATFTHNRGLFILILMGIILSENEPIERYKSTISKDDGTIVSL